MTENKGHISRIYVSWKSVGYPEYLDPPKAPAHYTDPLKIVAYVNKAKINHDKSACFTPGAMGLTEILAQDQTGCIVFDSSKFEEQSPAVAFDGFLGEEVILFHHKPWPSPAHDSRAVVMVLNAHIFRTALMFELAALDLLHENWLYDAAMFVDPYELVTSLAKKSIAANNARVLSPVNLAKAIGIAGDVVDGKFPTTLAQCNFLRKLCQRFKL